MIAQALTASIAMVFAAQTMLAAGHKMDRDKKVCRQDQSTGSILPRHICHTRSEWTAILEKQGDDTNNALVRRGNNRIQPFQN